MAILDSSGRPIQSGQLQREVAGGMIGSVRNPFDEIIATGMTPKQLASIIRGATQRDHEQYIRFASEMERRDPHYYSVLQTRKMAVAQLPRIVEPAKAMAEDAAEIEIAQILTGVLNSEGFTKTLMGILDALGKGFSVSEIVWRTDAQMAGRMMWLPRCILWRNQRFFRMDRETGSEILLRTAQNPDGEPLSAFKYIIHQPELVSGLPLAGGLARQVAAMHLFKSFAVRDWMAFAEVFGLPIRMGKYPANATPADVDTLREAVRNIGSDAAAVLPETMAIEFERAASSGNAGADEFFLTLADWLDKQVSKAVLGQTMTTEDGASLAQASVHNEVRLDIRNADAESLEDTINRDLIRPLVDLNFGPRASADLYPRVSLDREEPEDLQALATALTPFIDRGLPVAVSTILEKFGLPTPDELDPNVQLLGAMGAVGESDVSEEEESEDDEEDNMATAKTLRKIMMAAEKTTNMRRFKKQLAEILK